MKKFLVAATLCLSLSACVQANEEHAASKEANLWRRANNRAGYECGALTKAGREKAVEANDCVAAVVRRTVMPYAAYPDLVEGLINKQAEISRDFYDGKFDSAQAAAKAQQLQAQYQASVSSRLYGR